VRADTTCASTVLLSFASNWAVFVCAGGVERGSD
jgi:hypothetical protein